MPPHNFRRALAAGLTALAAAAAPLTGPLATPARAATAPVHPIRFPVDGPVRYSDDFGAPRPGGRTHQGNDLIGSKLEPEVAAVDGTITYVHLDGDGGISGNMLQLTGADGWFYYYIHINNDTPGTDDGRNPPEWRFAPGIQEGSHVLAGQFIAFMGDSGDAENTVPHLHFEVHPPQSSAVDPYPSLKAASFGGRPVVRGTAANPRGGWYVLTADGIVHPFGGAPSFGSDVFGSGARGMAVMPDGQGYVVLDAWGAVHKYGSAVAALGNLGGPWWPGWDAARGVALTPSGRGYEVLDAWGGVHPFGDAPVPEPSVSYWPGWDIARSVAVTPSGNGVYVLDGWGGVHVSGDATSFGGPYWPGWDIARGIVPSSTGQGYAVLDGWGGVHALGDAPQAASGSFAPGADWAGISRQGSHYVLARRDGLNGTW